MEVDTCEEVAVNETEEPKTTEIKGLPKSGRWWKETRSARHSAVIKVKPLKSSWEKKMADKAKMKQAKLLQQEIRERQQQEKQEKIERKKEQEKRRLENERKGEVVQVSKIRRKVTQTNREQLIVEKRDTS
ncbi:hypothetical protein COOONC_06855 [Cooperia oncophora]